VHQRAYRAGLKDKGLIRHAIIIEGRARDDFVALAKRARCSQGELLTALTTVGLQMTTELLEARIMRRRG